MLPYCLILFFFLFLFFVFRLGCLDLFVHLPRGWFPFSSFPFLGDGRLPAACFSPLFKPLWVGGGKKCNHIGHFISSLSLS
ncbi:hypothetical protein F4775DRAFT_68879 [Biscogniauxia sp. FL1348]|nr:hypothetical protein F4775DRAFT_68879 [Biscogniauxia sp. FL1348]